MLIEELNEKLERERRCAGCPMWGKAFVGADSKSGSVHHVSVLFLGLNPGTEEARQGRPFVGPSGQFLRKHIPEIAVDWAIINSILCSSPNQTGIVNQSKTLATCRTNVGYLWTLFTPDIIVPCGNGAAALFEIAEGIMKAENIYYISRGRSHNGRATVVAPIQHPSALIRSGSENSPKYANWKNRLDDIFNLAVALPRYKSPEETLADLNTPWQGLFGLQNS